MEKREVHYAGLAGLDWDDRPIEISRHAVGVAFKNTVLFPIDFVVWLAKHAIKAMKSHKIGGVS